MESRLVLVTGAASGIGSACARAFLQDGWHVAALDVSETGLRALGTGGRLTPLVADVTDASAVGAAVDALPPPVACVNAAGIYPMSSLDSADTELYRRIFDVNVLGTILVSQAVARVMPDHQDAAIVNFASVDAFVPKPSQLLYGAAKAAIVHLTRTMAVTLAPRGIRVNAVGPGPVDSEGMRRNPARLKEIVARTPLGRPASTGEVAALVSWLVSGEGARYVTGETVVASGGLVMR